MRKSKIKNYWITPEKVMEHNPCEARWNMLNVYAWFKGRKKVRLLTILKDKMIPENDRLWVVFAVVYMFLDVPSTWWVRENNAALKDIIAKIE